jgi:hypothetical protein
MTPDAIQIPEPTPGKGELVTLLSRYIDGGSPSSIEFSQAVLDAAEIYSIRNKERGGLWRRSGLKGQAFQLYSKAERLFMATQRSSVVVDDLHEHARDSIVYAIFAHILVNSGPDMNGEWPWKT